MIEKTGKIIKSLFIEEVEDSAAPASSEQPSPASAQSSPSPAAASSAASNSDVKKMIDRLSEVIASQNQDGFDYLEYRNAIKELILNGQPESTAFLTVFTTAKTLGVTKQSLVESANFYISLLESENSEFNNELNSAKNSDITEKENTIAMLEKEIAKSIKEKEKLEKEIQGSKDKLSSASSAFTAAYQNIHTKIKDDIQKLEKYVK
ncbi:MAG: hypothetical protein OEZ34_06010 [Spirochaetia bacterium]|nr:hypothetical protein [Spirochaetia bacterium]